MRLHLYLNFPVVFHRRKTTCSLTLKNLVDVASRTRRRGVPPSSAGCAPCFRSRSGSSREQKRPCEIKTQALPNQRPLKRIGKLSARIVCRNKKTTPNRRLAVAKRRLHLIHTGRGKTPGSRRLPFDTVGSRAIRRAGPWHERTNAAPDTQEQTRPKPPPAPGNWITLFAMDITPFSETQTLRSAIVSHIASTFAQCGTALLEHERSSLCSK